MTTEELEEKLTKIREWANSTDQGYAAAEVLDLLGDVEQEKNSEKTREQEICAAYDQIAHDIEKEGLDYYLRSYVNPSHIKLNGFDATLERMWLNYIELANDIEHRIKICGGRRAESK